MTAVGDVLWTPPADARERFEIGRYMDWLSAERGLDFADYDELQRWSVDDLEGFWGSLWDFFEIRAHTPYERVLGSTRHAGRGVVPGATLNYAEHMVGRDEDAGHGRGGRVLAVARPDRADLRRAARPGRACARRSAAARRRPGRPRRRATCPNIPETLVAFLATASLGAIWATCPPEFGVRSVLDRLGQLEPTVLLAVAGYRCGDKLVDRREQVAAIRAKLPSVRDRRPRSRTSAARTTRCPDARRVERAASPSPRRSSSTRCRSTIRSTSSSPPARRACRRRSCTGTAASSSST